MTNKLKLVFFALCICGKFSLSAQSEKIYSDWKGLEESPKLVDVSYRILACSDDNQTQVHLHVFNENSVDQTVNFILQLKDSEGNTAEIEVNGVQMKMAEMRSAECGLSDNADLKFAFPAGLNQENTTITITYKD